MKTTLLATILLCALSGIGFAADQQKSPSVGAARPTSDAADVPEAARKVVLAAARLRLKQFVEKIELASAQFNNATTKEELAFLANDVFGSFPEEGTGIDRMLASLKGGPIEDSDICKLHLAAHLAYARLSIDLGEELQRRGMHTPQQESRKL